MTTYLIYTDASSKPGRSAEVGIIVKNHHIIDIYYREWNKQRNPVRVEHGAVLNSVRFLKEKHGTDRCYVYTDCKSVAEMHPKFCKWVRGHQNRRTNWKHRFNCLADYISKNGLDNWRSYWETKLLM